MSSADHSDKKSGKNDGVTKKWIIIAIVVSAFIGIIAVNFLPSGSTSDKTTGVEFLCTSDDIKQIFGNDHYIAIQVNTTNSNLFSDACADIGGTHIDLCIHMVDDSHYQVQTKIGNLPPITNPAFTCSSNYTKWSQVP